MSLYDDIFDNIDEMMRHAREKCAYGKTYSPLHQMAQAISEL